MFLGARYERVRRLSHNKWLHLFMGAVASVGLAYAAVRSLAWGGVADTFRSFPIGYALLSLIPLAGAIVLRASRWYVLLQDEAVRFRDVLVAQNTGIGLNNLLPVRMVSEPVQLALVTRRYHVPFPAALATLVGGNVLDIFSTAILMTLGVILVPGLREGSIGLYMLGAFIMLVVSVLVFVAVSRGLSSIPVVNRMDFFSRILDAVLLLRDRPTRLYASFGATMAHWLLLGVAGWVLSIGLDMTIDPLTMAMILVAATFFTSAVPSLPGGAGTYHFAVVGMLTAMDLGGETAFSFAVVMHLLVFLPPSLIALVMISRVGAGVLLHRWDPPPLPNADVIETAERADERSHEPTASSR